MEIIKNGFRNERIGIELDVYVIGGKEWFRAKDISDYLGYVKSADLVRVISFDENIKTHIVRHVVNPRGTTFINEFGLYEVLCKINKTDLDRYNKAREFQKWVFSEVLPSIRKNNYYIDDKYVTKVQYDRLKDTMLLFCKNGKMGLPTASEKIFGDKRELNKRLILAKKINREICWYDSEWRTFLSDIRVRYKRKVFRWRG
ncbi:MAG: BRO-N domain-containing protein [Fusobacteriaceae bacterium]